MVAARRTARTWSLTNIAPEKVPAAALVRTTHRSPARQVGQAARTLPATDPCRRWACHGLGSGPAGPGSTGPSPCRSGGGGPPAQLPPAATPAIRQSHHPLLPGPGGMAISPGQAGLHPGLVARLRPTHQAGGHGQAEAASRFDRTPPPVGPRRTIWVRQRPEGAMAVGSSTVALLIA